MDLFINKELTPASPMEVIKPAKNAKNAKNTKTTKKATIKTTLNKSKK
jgi:hypothetical protein